MTMTVWRLVDGREPVDCPEAFPTVDISSEGELRQELERLRQLEPGIVSLSGPTEEALQIGIGGSFAGLRWYENAHVSERSRDILADRLYCPNRIDFAAEGDTIAFWPEHLMPVERVIEIVGYFFKHQRLPDWIGWKEWDPARKQWNIKPATDARSAEVTGRSA
jgi:hypothetical protein